VVLKRVLISRRGEVREWEGFDPASRRVSGVSSRQLRLPRPSLHPA